MRACFPLNAPRRVVHARHHNVAASPQQVMDCKAPRGACDGAGELRRTGRLGTEMTFKTRRRAPPAHARPSPAQLQRFRIVRASARFATDLRHVLLVPRTAVPTVLLGFTNQITVVAVVAILAAGLRLPVDFVDCLIIVPAALLLSALPITIAGWGLREGAFVVGFSFLGIGTNDALTLSLLFGFLNLIVRLPGGLLWLLTNDRQSVRKL